MFSLRSLVVAIALSSALGCDARGSGITITVDDDAGSTADTGTVADSGVSFDIPTFDISTDHGFPTDNGFPVDHGFPSDNGFPVDHGFPSDNGFPVDHGFPTDNGFTTDRGFPVDRGFPTDVPATTSTGVGGPCRTDSDCGSTAMPFCLRSLNSTGFCTDNNLCTNGSAASEQTQCGGRGTTCLTNLPFDVTDGSGLCTRACTVNALTEEMGACRAGLLCTGFWFRATMGNGDSPGCFPFCSSDSDCVGVIAGDASVMRCNTRTGFCSTAPANLSLRADGEPCNPQEVTSTMRPQCRGVCFSVSTTAPTRGLCGSFINLRAATYCGDNPTQAPIVPTDSVTNAASDEIGICVRRGCTRNADCTAPLLCLYPEDAMGGVHRDLPPTCGYATAAQPGGVS